MTSTQRSSLAAAAFAVATLAAAAPARADSFLVAEEPFLAASTEIFTIDGSTGEEARSRAVVTTAGVVRAVTLLPNQQPLAGSLGRACIRKNGVDTTLCGDYGNAHWPSPVRVAGAVPVAAGDVLTVRVVEVLGQSTGANFRITLQVASPTIFGDGFETNDTIQWTKPSPAVPAMLITGEPFVSSLSGDNYSIGGSSGEESRNRAAISHAGTLRDLYVLPNQQPAVGGEARACVRKNGADTGLCVTYLRSDWPNPKSNTATTVSVAQGDLVSVRVTEIGAGTNANLRASFALADGGAEGTSMVVTGEPFLAAGFGTFSIGAGSSGDETRNRATVPIAGSIFNLFVIPNQQPAVGSSVTACLRKNGVDTTLCVTYTAADWSLGTGAKGNVANLVPVAAGDVVSVHFTGAAGTSSGANFRASFDFR